MQSSKLIRKWKFSPGTAVIILITLAGFILRVWGVDFGLPYTYHIDEHFYVVPALYIGKGQLVYPPYAPVLFSNLIFINYAFYFVIGKIAGLFPIVAAFESSYRSDPTPFYLIARYINVILGTLSIPVAYFLSRKIALLKGRNEREAVFTAVVASILIGAAFFHVRDSHYAVPDIATTFFLLSTAWICAYNLERKTVILTFLAGLCSAAAFTLKWISGIGLLTNVVLLLALWLFPQGKRIFPFMQTVVTVAGFFFGTIFFAPQLLIAPELYLQELFLHIEKDFGSYGIWKIDNLVGWLFYLKVLLTGIGPVMLSLAIGGGIYAVWLFIRSRRISDLLLLAFPIAYFIYMSSMRLYFGRYIIPVIPFMAIFAAEFIINICVYLALKKQILFQVAVIILTLVAVSQPLVYSVQHDLLVSSEDTRTEAKKWIESNIPSGAKIAADWQVHTPPLSTPDEPRPYSTRTYDLTILAGIGLGEHTLEWYVEQGYDYLITSSYIKQASLSDPRRSKQKDSFYQTLEPLAVVKEFHPGKTNEDLSFVFDEIYGPFVSLFEREQPGPTIKIYQLP